MFRKTLLVLAVSLLFTFAICAQGSSSATAASTTESTKKSPVFRPTKDQIKQVQSILKTKSLYSGEASGTYNDDTRAGIKTFQKSSGLKETGTLNRATLEKFGVELTESQKLIPVSEGSYAKAETEAKPAKVEKTSSVAASEDKPRKAAPFRATKEQIVEAQKLLKSKGMYSGEGTGKLDDATRDSLKKSASKLGKDLEKRLQEGIMYRSQ